MIYRDLICNEAENGGRFKAGLPVVSDASLLFVQHMISKIHSHTSDMPSRIALIVNGSVLVRGSAGSGESNIRRWIIENDFLESIIALPTELHYNTSIATYIWIITSCKEPKSKGKIQLINATDMYVPIKKSIGCKRKKIGDEEIENITQWYLSKESSNTTKLIDNSYFGYARITIERPLQLNFSASKERIIKLKNNQKFLKLADENQEELLSLLGSIGEAWFKNKDEFICILENIIKDVNITNKKDIIRVMWQSLGEHDEFADFCIDSDGNYQVPIDHILSF